MSASQSQFSILPKNQLVFISKRLIDKDFPSSSPYESYDYDKTHAILENIAKYFSMVVTDEDVEFFAKFLEVNDEVLSKIFETNDKSLYEQLVIPVAKRYKVEYEVYGTCTYYEYLETTWDSYDWDWVTDSMRQARDNGNWDTYDGKSTDIEYDNFDMHDYQFNDITEISDVVESTDKNKIIESLDKKTLLELRGLIDDKLRRL